MREVAREVMKTPVGNALDRQLLALSNLLAPKAFEAPAPAQPMPPPPAPRKLARPPGALKDRDKFYKACTRCADCIVACPYGVLFQMGPRSGPLLDPNLNACRLCKDMPCIEACETGALKKLRKNQNPRIGIAVVTETLCRNHESRRPKLPAGKKAPECKICQKECPVKGAIVFGKDKLPDVQKSCTGCGLCVHVCPNEAIKIDVF